MNNFVYLLVAHIINLSLTIYATTPPQFKIAEVISIFKRGSKYDVLNYHPVAIISNLTKVFNKVLFTSLVEFFNEI